MKQSLNTIVFSFSFILFSCSYDSKTLVQKINTKSLEINLNKVNSGAFGETAEIQIFDMEGNLLEEIGLRGEDYFPKIDSVVDENIFISYSYPTQTELLDFEQVALGEALINKSRLKFKYVFTNNN